MRHCVPGSLVGRARSTSRDDERGSKARGDGFGNVKFEGIEKSMKKGANGEFAPFDDRL